MLLDLAGRGGQGRMRRAGALVRKLLSGDEHLVTTRFNVAELYVGVERSDDPRRERTKVGRILTGLEVLDFDDSAAHIFGSLTAHLQVLGRPAGDLDVLIASVAIANAHILVTRNPRHFMNLPGLFVRGYD